MKKKFCLSINKLPDKKQEILKDILEIFLDILNLENLKDILSHPDTTIVDSGVCLNKCSIGSFLKYWNNWVFFHFCQFLYRKEIELGGCVEDREDKNFNFNLRSFYSTWILAPNLPFRPRFVDYFEEVKLGRLNKIRNIRQSALSSSNVECRSSHDWSLTEN